MVDVRIFGIICLSCFMCSSARVLLDGIPEPVPEPTSTKPHPSNPHGEMRCLNDGNCNWPQGRCDKILVLQQSGRCKCDVGWAGDKCQTPTLPGKVAIYVDNLVVGSFKEIPKEDFPAVDKNGKLFTVDDAVRRDVIHRGYKFVITKEYHANIRFCSTQEPNGPVSCENLQVVVPKGYLCDGNTSRQYNNSPAWVYHDWLYISQHINGRPISRHEADKIFLRIMMKAPVKGERGLTQLALQAAGILFDKSWEIAGERGAEFAQLPDL